MILECGLTANLSRGMGGCRQLQAHKELPEHACTAVHLHGGFLG